MHIEIGEYCKNLLMGYLNLNSLRNEIIDKRIILQDLQLNYCFK